METKYQFLRIAATIFRVIGWIVLVLGVIGSIVMGTQLEVFGVLYAIFGIVYSVIGWISLLAFAEILHLLIDLEQNTRETAERLGTGSANRLK